MEPSRKDKTAMAHEAVSSAIDMANGKKLKSVKIKIKFDNAKIGAVKKRAKAYSAYHVPDKGVTR